MKFLPLVLLLAGCATTQTPEPIVRTVEVQVPVRQPCVPSTLGPAPIYADTDAALLGASDPAERYQLLGFGRAQRIVRLNELETVIAGCR